MHNVKNKTMKKYTAKHIKYLLQKSRSEIVRRKKRKQKEYNPTQRSYQSDIKAKSKLFYDLKAPSIFNLQYGNVNEVLGFIEDIKAIGAKKKYINIRLEDVTEIGEGAISMLLSVLNELSSKNVRFKGTKPNLSEPKDILEKSGFFKYIRGIVSDKNLNTKNIILRTGNIATHQKELSPEILKSMETVWSVKSRCPILFGGIGEMLRNSCDHAFVEKESTVWHLSISHFEKESTVKYSFVDNGEGIIGTYNKKGLITQIGNFFNNNNAEILDNAFRNGIESRTGLTWRGKGLPTIFEMYQDNIISNLVVITNNVYLDFDNQIFENLNNNFNGTYYFWKVNKSCTPSYFI